MASKRDQLQSYRFLLQRMMHALVLRETDPEHPPFRRAVQAGWGGLAVAVLALAATWVYGLIKPGGNDDWRDGKSIIAEDGTGARFVYVNGVLYPVANYASALLVLQDHAAVVTASGDSLGDTPRGPTIGIPGAPDTLPHKGSLLGGDWSLCTRPAVAATGSRVDTSVLLVGAAPARGTATGDAALLVRTASHKYLLWRGYRHEITDPATATSGLALGGESWSSAGPAWLDVVPEGPPIAPIAPAGLGTRSRALVPATTGQLYVVQTAAGVSQYYLVEAHQLRPISALQYDVQRAWAPTRRAYHGNFPTALPLDPAVAAQAPLAPGAGDGVDQLPSRRPTFMRERSPLAATCATFADGGSVPRLTVGPRLPPANPAAVTPRHSGDGLPVADRVIVAPGHGALVQAVPAPGAPTGPLYLVTDLGRRFALSGAQQLTTLGLDGARPVAVPAGLLARIPAGPSLDPAAAFRPV